MSESIDQDITQTLYKLQVLLEYSTSTRAEEVAELIKKAKTVWNEETEEGTWEE